MKLHFKSWNPYWLELDTNFTIGIRNYDLTLGKTLFYWTGVSSGNYISYTSFYKDVQKCSSIYPANFINSIKERYPYES